MVGEISWIPKVKGESYPLLEVSMAVSMVKFRPATEVKNIMVLYWSYWSFNEHSTSATHVGVSLDSTPRWALLREPTS